MDISLLFPLISLFVSLGLGLLVLVKARRGEMALVFLIMSLSLMLINLSYLMVPVEISSLKTLLGARLLCFGIRILVPTFFYFTLLITHRQDLIKKRYPLIIYLLTLISVFIEATQLKEESIYSWDYLPQQMPLGLLYYHYLFLALITIVSLRLLYEGSIVLTSKKDRIVAKYLFWGGLVCASLLAIDLLPFYGLRVGHFGHITLTLYLFSIAWIILRRRLVSIEVIFKETFLFSLLTGSIMAIFMISLFFLEWRGLSGSLFPSIAASIVVATVFQPLRNKIDLSIKRLFAKRTCCWEEILSDFRHTLSSTFSSTFSSELFLKHLSDTLKKAFVSEHTSILLPNNGYQDCLNEKKVLLGVDDPIINYLRKGKILNDYNLENEPELRDSSSSKEFFVRWRIAVLVPIISEKKLLAILALGEKENGLSYTSEEFRFLMAICREAAVGLENVELFEELRDQLLGVAKALITAMELKDWRVSGHAERVAELAAQIAAELKLPKRRIADIKVGASLHDIGKMGLPDEVLQKREKLTPEEWREVKLHPIKGYDIILPIRFSEDVSDGVKYHHEKFNGEGYPYGLEGEEIPLAGRIVALANAYEAMTSERFYRRAKSCEEAKAEIRAKSGEWFDPKIVDAFFQILERKRFIP
ncbi:TPA: hypothetical protein DCX15_05755 [bacterium]|nr:hypothetical protein [bacterium]